MIRKPLVQRLLALLLMVAILWGAFPAGTVESALADQIGTVTADGVNVRKQPSSNSTAWFKVSRGHQVTVLDSTTRGGVTWYKVNTIHPDPDNDHTYVGYIQGDFLSVSGVAAPVVTTAPSGGSGSASTNTTVTGATGTITNGEVNFRATEGGEVLSKLDRGTVVELLSIPSVIDSSHWYQVRYDGKIGYVQAPFIRVTSTGSGAATVPTVTAAPVSTPTGYVKLILSSANLRKSPGGAVQAQWETQGQMLPVVGATSTQGGYTWYPVSFNGATLYVRGDCVQLVTGDGSVPEAPPTAAPEVTAAPVVTAAPTVQSGSYVKLILSSANLRVTPGGKKADQWEKTGEVLAIQGTPVVQDGYAWYPVVYGRNNYWVRGDCVQVLTQSEATITVTAAPSVSAIGYVKTTLSGVNLRLKPAGDYVRQVDKNVVLPMLAPAEEKNGYAWYYVAVGDVRGYVRGDCVVVCDANGNTSSVAPTTAPTSAPVQAVGYVKLTTDKVNLRQKPGGKVVEQLPVNLILPMTAAATASGAYSWYPVRTNDGKTGYVRSDCITLCDASGNALVQATPTPEVVVTTGYVKITASSTNFRKTPGGTKISSLEKNKVWPMVGATTSANGYTWYPIRVNDQTGYVRGDCAFQLSAAQTEAYLANGTVPAKAETPDTSATTQVSYVRTVVDKVNLRASASKDASAPYNVALGTVMAYNDTRTVGGSLWYKVIYSNNEVWVLGSCVKVMTAAEYQQYIAANPAATPQPQVVKGHVKTTSSGVNLRTQANGDKIIGRIDKGVTMPYSADPVVVRGYTWYYVTAPDGQVGYIRGDCAEPVQADGSPVPTQAPIQGGGSTSSGTSGQEASYKTLRKGSSGTAVKEMVAELKAQGYFSGSITSSFTSSVETAVKSFQKAKGLTVDGVAGPKTLHALFGTVPEGSGSSDNLTMAIYPAEKIDWYSGGIQQLWPKGANFKVYDVKTGIVWWAHRWSGGNHVDAEPLTAADTARLCKTYGVSSADKIESNNLWQRRPLLVTIGNRTFACSLYGIPHNYPEGDTISTNNYKGQLCIHFTNSKTHASNKVDTYHTEAIEYAWRNAPNGRK